MPSIWDLVKYRSTISEGTAYEHLTSELGNPIIVSATVESDVVESLTAEVSVEEVSATVTEEILTAEATQDLTAEVDSPVLTADAIILIG